MIQQQIDEHLWRMRIDAVYRYWNSRVEKCNLKEASLKRQLVETNVGTPDWEEYYQLLMNVQDERESIFYNLQLARTCWNERYITFPCDNGTTIRERLDRHSLADWLEVEYERITGKAKGVSL